MKITRARFDVYHGDKGFVVTYDIQQDQASSFVVEIADASGKILDQRVGKGRQAVSPWNAKEAVRRFLVEQGVLKPRKGESVDPAPVKTWGDHNGRNLLNDTEPLPPAESAPEKKPRRKEKKILKSKAGDPPNEYGVYEYADQEIVFSTKGVYAEVTTLELEDNSFIWATKLQLRDSGSSGPLSIHHGKRATSRKEAIKEALDYLVTKQSADKYPKEARKLVIWIGTVLSAIDSFAAEQPQRIDLYKEARDIEDEDDNEEPSTEDEHYIRKKIKRSRKKDQVSETKSPDPETKEGLSESLPFDLNDL
jgi:hypothetical protein